MTASTAFAQEGDPSCGTNCPEGNKIIKFEWDDKSDDGNGCYMGFLVETSEGYLMDGSDLACFEADGDGNIEYGDFDLPVKVTSVELDEDEIKSALVVSGTALLQTGLVWYKSGSECDEIEPMSQNDGGNIAVIESFQGISHIAMCYAPPRCPYPEFTEQVLSTKAPGQVQLTVSSSEGITGVNFVDDLGDPYLINFTVTSSDLVSSDGIHWAPSGTPPTSSVLLLTQTDASDGYAAYYAEVENQCGSVTHIDPALQFEEVPETFKVEGNYPNPFNPTTNIRFTLSEPAAVSVTVYDVTGREVKQLVVGRDLDAGVHTAEWDGTDVQGRQVVSGIYLYRINAGGQSANGKMVLLK